MALLEQVKPCMHTAVCQSTNVSCWLTTLQLNTIGFFRGQKERVLEPQGNHLRRRNEEFPETNTSSNCRLSLLICLLALFDQPEKCTKHERSAGLAAAF